MQELLYTPQANDVYYTLENIGGSADKTATPAVINLNAITYYARMGMKPKRIGVLVGCNHTTIWDNNRLRQAYENGAAYHELMLRTIAMQEAESRPGAAYEMLNRAVGKPEDDAAEGFNPADREQRPDAINLVFRVQDTTNDPVIQELKAELENRIKQANNDNPRSTS